MPQGYQASGDVLVDQLNDGTPLGAIWGELAEALSLYNEHRSALANLLSYNTLNAADAVPQNVKAEEFDEASEYGLPQGISYQSYLKLGYSINDFDLALRMTWRYLRAADRAQVENRIARAFAADNRLVSGTILQRLFSNVVYTNDFGHPVYGLYNGDMKPPDHMGRSFDATHNHFLVTESATLDSMDVEAGIKHISEHGYGSTQSARFLLLVHPDDVEAAKLTTWRAGVEYTTNKVPKFDFIASSNAPARLSNETVHGAVPPSEYNGLDVTGSYGKALVIESYFIPQGWAAIVASGGPGSESNPIGVREHSNPSYRGLRLLPGHWRDYPLIEAYLQRTFGVGVRHRGAAVAIQITTNTSYTPPVIQT